MRRRGVLVARSRVARWTEAECTMAEVTPMAR